MFIKNYAHDGIYCNVPLGAWQTHPGLYFPPFSIFDSKEVPKVNELASVCTLYNSFALLQLTTDL